MKKRFIIYSLFLSGSFLFSLSIQAQEQKKPSERSFATEINKVKQIQAARNTTIRQMPQPEESNNIVNDNKQAIKKDQPNNTTTSDKQDKQATKPSSGAMRKSQKPAASKE